MKQITVHLLAINGWLLRNVNILFEDWERKDKMYLSRRRQYSDISTLEKRISFTIHGS